jgi:hypothetical protein
MANKLISTTFQNGYRLFAGEGLNKIVTAVNSLSIVVQNVNSAVSTATGTTLTAAQIVGGIINRTGTSAGFTDTTDTAVNLVAAIGIPSAQIGFSFNFTIINNTLYAQTLTGGTGVTVSGVTVIPANTIVQYLVTYTAANTFTFVATTSLPITTKGTVTINGATPVTVANTAVSANSIISFTLKTVGGTVGAIPAIQTITVGTGFTVAGTASDTSVYNYEIRG